AEGAHEVAHVALDRDSGVAGQRDADVVPALRMKHVQVGGAPGYGLPEPCVQFADGEIFRVDRDAGLDLRAHAAAPTGEGSVQVSDWPASTSLVTPFVSPRAASMAHSSEATA